VVAALPLSSADLDTANAGWSQAQSVLGTANQQLADIDHQLAQDDATFTDLQQRSAASETDRETSAALRDRVRGDLRELAVTSYTSDHVDIGDLWRSPSPSDATNDRITTTLAASAMKATARRLHDLDAHLRAVDRQIAQQSQAITENRLDHDALVARRPAAQAAVDTATMQAQAASDVASAAHSAALVGGTDIGLVALDAYWRAAQAMRLMRPTCGIQWWGLAGVGYIESRHGHSAGGYPRADGSAPAAILGPPLDGTTGYQTVRDTDHGFFDGDPLFDRAVGPMQFLPGTWRRWGADGNGDHVNDPQNMYDAALGAARYLCSGGGGLDTDPALMAAYRRYNNDTSYVLEVLARARAYQAALPSLVTPSAP
jgi:membrane-bound lytic murein transglycosylase B